MGDQLAPHASRPMTVEAVATEAVEPLDDRLLDTLQTELTEYLALRTAASTGIDPVFAEATEELAAFVLTGGKRLRPTFAWWGWRGAGGAADTAEALAVVRAIGALELIQACALIHDDLMDASATRRGRPTVHVEFARRHVDAGWDGPPARFGAAVAILLGDLALAWADDMMRAAGLPADAAARAVPPWEAMRTEVLGGQFLDVLGQAKGDRSAHAALQIDRFKTAAYTVERPLHLGGALAGAGPELIAAYRRFGADIGVAFQLRDDLLGVFGDPMVTGKPAGDDLREGKRTLLLAIAAERAAELRLPNAGKEIDAAVGDPDLGAEGVDRVRGLLTELGAVDAVEERIATLTGAALDTLATAPIAEPAATRLAALAIASTSRAA